MSLTAPTDNDECANCAGILEELENIDDDCDRHGIVFVKTKDFSIAEEYGVVEYPALVYFESSVPNVFEGGVISSQGLLVDQSILTFDWNYLSLQANCEKRRRCYSG